MRISDERLAERAIREQRGVKIKINKTAYATGLKNSAIGIRHGFQSGSRDRDHEERGVPVTDVPRHMPLARGILQQDKIPGA